MKRKIILAFTLLFTLFSVSCKGNDSSSNKGNLNYQNDPRIMVERNESASIIESTYQDIEAKIIKKETFILYIHQNGCLACKAFTPVLTKYVEKYKVPVYAIETSLIPSENTKIYYSYTPTIQIFKNGELKDSQDPVVNDSKMFTLLEDLEKYMKDQVIVNNLLYISDTTLDAKIANKETFVVYYGWKSCGDCQMMSKMFLNEYLYNTKDENKPLFALEVDPWRSQKAYHPEVWEAFTSKYHLSKTRDDTFGYRTGVVPTIHYYKDGVLTKSVVYFNDVLKEVENGGYAIDFEAEDGVFSYYPEEVKQEFGDVIFTDYQDYKDKTNDFYKEKLLELFEIAYK